MKRKYILTVLILFSFTVFICMQFTETETTDTAETFMEMGESDPLLLQNLKKTLSSETEGKKEAGTVAETEEAVNLTEDAANLTDTAANLDETGKPDSAHDASNFDDSPSGGISTPTQEERAIFAAKIQEAVSAEQLEALAALCGYPVFLSTSDGTGLEITTKADFLNLDPEQIFTEELKSAIASVNLDELELFGAGVILGDEHSIVFNKIEGELVVTGIQP